MIRGRRLSRGMAAPRDEPGWRCSSSLVKRWLLSFRNVKIIINSLAKANTGAGNTWQENRKYTEFQTTIIILFGYYLSEGNQDVWVRVTEVRDENHLQHGQLLA